ncbi:MAG TPA: sigma-54 dependent transcriptional regulator [Polyangiaceae bacterium]
MTTPSLTAAATQLPTGGPAPTATGELVAVVEDDPTTRRLVRAWLEGAGYSVAEYDSARAVREGLGNQTSVACIDLHLGESSGFEVMNYLRERDQELPTIVVTADGEVQTAVAAMRAGAYDYLTKPIDRDCLLLSVRRACERRRLVDRVKNLQTALGSGRLFESIVGSSPAMRELSQQVERVLESDVAVCLQGESGTGKELVARAIHQGGPRRNGPFVAINCAAIPASLQESELFGHERGAFTGATQTRLGCFERARGGTLLLDEIGEMSPAVQAVLLRTLQERTVRRVGGNQEIPTDVRIVCATHRDLRSEVDAGRFREDLYFRLVVYPIRLPTLRNRVEDIPLLITHFLDKLRARSPHGVRFVAPEALEALARHGWPGNVRELENVVHRCVLAARSDLIELADLPPDLRVPGEPASGPVMVRDATEDEDDTIVPLRELEERAIKKALRVTRGSVGRAAKLLGIGRATLYRRIAEIDLPLSMRESAS